ncbi:hypothetical protein BKA93DRAFT_228736 [Sparassis latifolia]
MVQSACPLGDALCRSSANLESPPERPPKRHLRRKPTAADHRQDIAHSCLFLLISFPVNALLAVI